MPKRFRGFANGKQEANAVGEADANKILRPSVTGGFTCGESGGCAGCGYGAHGGCDVPVRKRGY